ncbi:MAG: peptidylprolyl isomerase, partial [Burkholderiales bacterium]
MKLSQIIVAGALFAAGTLGYAANPQVELQTSAGTVVLELFPDAAPKT